MTTRFVRQKFLNKKPHKSRDELFQLDKNAQHSKQNWWQNYMSKYTKKERIFAWFMMVMVVVESVFLFLQAAKGFETKSTEDIDLAAFILLLVINVMWFFYGLFVVKDIPIMLSAVLYVIGSALVILTIILYGDGSSAEKQLLDNK